MVKSFCKVLILMLLAGALDAFCDEIDFSDAFAKYPEGCIVLFDTENNRSYFQNPQRCEKQFLPASTFKIINAMIGLETGVVKGANHMKEWDGVERQIKSWNRDHDLKSAFEHSAVWYFERFAEEIGAEGIGRYLSLCDYGNKLTSGGMPFWLEGDLAISAIEQVEFLRRLHDRNLPFKRGVMETVVGFMLLEEQDGFKLYGKTGWSQSDDGNLGWFVGWVESEKRTVFFATNIEHNSSVGFGAARKAITFECLKRIKSWR